jgi:hypothetical protein
MSRLLKKSGGQGAVQYLNQFPKNFLRPYGRQDNPPTEQIVYRRIKPESCEWLVRPKVAISEMAETIQQNLEVLEEQTGGTLLRASSLVRFKTAFDQIADHLPLLNTKQDVQPTADSVKVLLKFLCDDDLDKIIDEAYNIGSALFAMATHVIVARSLIRNSEKYADTFAPLSPTKEEKNFKSEKTLKSLKKMLNAYYFEAASTSQSGTNTTKKRLFAEIDSDEEAVEEEPTAVKPKKQKSKDHGETSMENQYVEQAEQTTRKPAEETPIEQETPLEQEQSKKKKSHKEKKSKK